MHTTNLHDRRVAEAGARRRRFLPSRLFTRATLPALLLLAACSPGSEHTSAVAPGAHASFTKLEWAQLIPAEELENSHLAMAFAMRRIDHSSDQRAPQFGSFKTVDTLDGRRVSLAGYVVPLEMDDQGRMTDFFLVPTIGACIHVPPPPPDQMVYVHLTQAIPAPELGDAGSLQGVLRTTKHDAEVASAAYSMDEAQLIPKPRE
jgi:hypothetical protein